MTDGEKMTESEILFYRKKINDKAYMNNSVSSIADKFADEYVKRGLYNTPQKIKLPKENKENKMKNSLCDLNNHLFVVLERLLDDDVCHDEESTNKEINKARIVCDVSKVIVENAKVQLDALKYRENFNIDNARMPDLLMEK